MVYSEAWQGYVCIPHWTVAYSTPGRHTAVQVCHQDAVSTCTQTSLSDTHRSLTDINDNRLWSGSRMCLKVWKVIYVLKTNFLGRSLKSGLEQTSKLERERRVPNISSCGLFMFHFSSEQSCLTEPDIWRCLQTKPRQPTQSLMLHSCASRRSSKICLEN